ncbi:DUF1707 SHOCT-like domain-containing protein [Fodinicola acaciae]|uniref:DUF1707 SHOCT-like domain-containing protein n=1 Tax=Fodinicola acaciae TaxID=2681555 RepID=UPI0013D2D7D2|nr:DUF1707 domain-containing protein [Fodinicola acaciae]
MTDELRIGDAEREAAIAALGEHLSAGRLTLDEYGTRSAEATSATTRGDLLALFKDLPAPHPTLETPAPAVDLAKRPERPVARVERGELAKRIVTGISAASWMLWIPLAVVSHWSLWWLMFIPIGLSAFAGKIWYPDDDDRDDRDRRQRRRARRHGW